MATQQRAKFKIGGKKKRRKLQSMGYLEERDHGRVVEYLYGDIGPCRVGWPYFKMHSGANNTDRRPGMKWMNLTKGEKQPTRIAPRILEMKLGRHLGEDLVAGHLCNNEECFNEDHIYETTATENIDYAVACGTKTAFGDMFDQLNMLREFLTGKYSIADLREMYDRDDASNMIRVSNFRFAYNLLNAREREIFHYFKSLVLHSNLSPNQQLEIILDIIKNKHTDTELGNKYDLNAKTIKSVLKRHNSSKVDRPEWLTPELVKKHLERNK